jgi:hypothetical protein
MAAGSHGDHAPVSVELGRNCGRSGTDDCESGRQSEGALTIANHGSPHTCVVLLVNSSCPGREARLFDNEHKTANCESIDPLEA